MSRSKLKNKYMQKRYDGHSFLAAKMNNPVRNPHRQDEMPKNRPSRLVLNHCSADIHWLEDWPYRGGHSRKKGGHRRVSGLVRASLKEEFRQQLLEQLKEAVP